MHRDNQVDAGAEMFTVPPLRELPTIGFAHGSGIIEGIFRLVQTPSREQTFGVGRRNPLPNLPHPEGDGVWA